MMGWEFTQAFHRQLHEEQMAYMRSHSLRQEEQYTSLYACQDRQEEQFISLYTSQNEEILRTWRAVEENVRMIQELQAQFAR